MYRLGQELVLRVPRDHEGHIAQAHREARAIPAAVASGVRTPRLVAFDDSREILPVPFLIVERVEGHNAESLGVERPPAPGTWPSVGADMARLHRFAPPALPPPEPWALSQRGPRELVEARAQEGWLSVWEARRLLDWLDRLAPLLAAPSEVFVHGDLQMANVLVHPVARGYQAVIDWGNAYVGDPNDDLAAVPLAVARQMLTGYRSVAGATSAVNEASILWRRIHRIFQFLPQGRAPGLAWAERPIGRLVDLLLDARGFDESLFT